MYCQRECGTNFLQGSTNCTGFNYLPNEIPSFLADVSQVIPCYQFFTGTCKQMTEARIFFKAFTPKQIDEAKRIIRQDFKGITNASINMVTYGNSTIVPVKSSTISDSRMSSIRYYTTISQVFSSSVATTIKEGTTTHTTSPPAKAEEVKNTTPQSTLTKAPGITNYFK